MGLSRTVFELVGDFSRKLQNFPTPVYFATPLTGFPLELFIGVWGQNTRVTGLSGQARSFRIYSAVWIQCTNMPDGQTAIGRQQTPRLRIASRGEKKPVTIVLKDSRVLCWKVHSWVDSEMKRQTAGHSLLLWSLTYASAKLWGMDLTAKNACHASQLAHVH